MAKTPDAPAASEKAPEEGPLSFPYKTLEAAAKDKYARIGGPEQALRFLTKGWKNYFWRKRTETRSKTDELAEAEEAGIKLPVKRPPHA